MSTYHAAVAQSRAYRAVKSRVSEGLRPHGLTMMQWSIIGLIYDADDKGIRISDLAQELDSSLAFITTSVNILEAKSMVQRVNHEHDSRAKLVSVTKKFRPKVMAIETALHKDLTDWLYSSIKEKDLSTYVDVLEQIAKKS